METIRIKRGDDVVVVDKYNYIVAKTRQLREFGYGNLSEDEVRLQLDLVLAGKTEDLTVIGQFIQDDIVFGF